MTRIPEEILRSLYEHHGNQQLLSLVACTETGILIQSW
jgi:hypothetical protein